MASPHIEGTDNASEARSGQMNIDRCAVNGTVAQMLLDHQEIRPLLIEMGGKGMPEGVGSHGTGPSQPLKVLPDINASRVGGDGRPRFSAWEKPFHRFAVSSPIVGEDIQCRLREQGIAIRPVLRTADKEALLFAFDVLVAEMADLADAKA